MTGTNYLLLDLFAVPEEVWTAESSLDEWKALMKPCKNIKDGSLGHSTSCTLIHQAMVF